MKGIKKSSNVLFQTHIIFNDQRYAEVLEQAS